ncbi:MAG: amidase [Porticoccaceae bacterium]
MHHKTLAQLAAGLESGEFSSVELTRHYLDRIARFDAPFNSYISVTATALARAEADQQRASGSNFTCIPIAYKDIFALRAFAPAAAPECSTTSCPHNATVVENFNSVGTVTPGKTNMDEFAMGSSNETSLRPVKNPWNTQTVPGGPVARRQRLQLGWHQRLPLRILAFHSPNHALCGVTSPETHLWTRVSAGHGLPRLRSSISGLITRTAEDAYLMMNVMASFDQRLYIAGPHTGLHPYTQRQHLVV